MNRTNVYIRGLGAYTPYGEGADIFFWSLCNGKESFSEIERFDTSDCMYRRGGEIKELNRFAPVDPLALIFPVVEESLSDAGISDRNTCSLVLSTNFGDADARLNAFSRREWRNCDFHSVTLRAAEKLGLGGICQTTSLSCSSGLSAVAAACDLIRMGDAQTVVACGYDLLTSFAWSGLSVLRTMTTDKVMPFSKDRSGTIFSEGAGAVVLSCEPGFAGLEVTGYGLSNNAFHMTAPDKHGDGYIRALSSALNESGVALADIDHVNLHGTGTRLNDPAEAQAVKTALGKRARQIPCTANKAALGHAMGAAGILETIATVYAMREGVIPPTIHIKPDDPACGVNLVRGKAAHLDIRNAVTLSSGIGGNNAALVISRY